MRVVLALCFTGGGCGDRERSRNPSPSGSGRANAGGGASGSGGAPAGGMSRTGGREGTLGSDGIGGRVPDRSGIGGSAVPQVLGEACSETCNSYVPACMISAGVAACIERCVRAPWHSRFPDCQKESLALISCEGGQVDTAVMCACAGGCQFNHCGLPFLDLLSCFESLPPLCATTYSDVDFDGCKVKEDCTEGRYSYQASCWHPADPGPWQCHCARSDGYAAALFPPDTAPERACEAALQPCHPE